MTSSRRRWGLSEVQAAGRTVPGKLTGLISLHGVPDVHRILRRQSRLRASGGPVFDC